MQNMSAHLFRCESLVVVLTLLVLWASVSECRYVAKQNNASDVSETTKHTDNVNTSDEEQIFPFAQRDEKILAQNKQELLRRKIKLISYLKDAAGHDELLERLCKYLYEKYAAENSETASKSAVAESAKADNNLTRTIVEKSGTVFKQRGFDTTRRQATAQKTPAPLKIDPEAKTLTAATPGGAPSAAEAQPTNKREKFLINVPNQDNLTLISHENRTDQLMNTINAHSDALKRTTSTQNQMGNALEDAATVDVLENPDTVNFSMPSMVFEDEYQPQGKDSREQVDYLNKKNIKDDFGENYDVIPKRNASGKRSVNHHKLVAPGVDDDEDNQTLGQRGDYWYHDNEPTSQVDCALRKELLEHSFLEDKHIQDIREEVAKLKELVQIVRDQQYMLNLLKDGGTKDQPKTGPYPSAIAPKITPEEFQVMLKVMQLLQLQSGAAGAAAGAEDKIHFETENEAKTLADADPGNAKEVLNPRKRNKVDGNGKAKQQISALKKELEGLKSQMKERTGDNSKLASELEDERKEIEGLKQELANLTNVRDNPLSLKLPVTLNGTGTDEEEVVGAKHVLSLDSDEIQNVKAIKKHLKSAKEPTKSRASLDSTMLELLKQLNTGEGSSKGKEDADIEELQREIELLEGNGVDDASAEQGGGGNDAELAQLLKELNLDGTNGVESKSGDSDSTSVALKLFEVQEKMEKKKQKLKEQELENRIDALNLKIKKKKHLDDDDDDKMSKTLDDEDDIESQIQKLKRKLHKKKAGKKQSKAFDDDDDVKSELAALQDAIHKLQPKDDLDLDLDLDDVQEKDESDGRHLSSLISKLFLANKVKPAVTATKLTKLELLKKKLALLNHNKRPLQSGGGGFGEGPGTQYPFPGGNFGNAGYMGPYGPYPWASFYGPGGAGGGGAGGGVYGGGGGSYGAGGYAGSYGGSGNLGPYGQFGGQGSGGYQGGGGGGGGGANKYSGGSGSGGGVNTNQYDISKQYPGTGGGGGSGSYGGGGTSSSYGNDGSSSSYGSGGGSSSYGGGSGSGSSSYGSGGGGGSSSNSYGGNYGASDGGSSGKGQYASSQNQGGIGKGYGANSQLHSNQNNQGSYGGGDGSGKGYKGGGNSGFGYGGNSPYGQQQGGGSSGGSSYGLDEHTFLDQDSKYNNQKSDSGSSYSASQNAGTNKGKLYGITHQSASILDKVYAKQSVDELKSQIYSLQKVIHGLNSPEYQQTPEDQQTVYKLNKQITELQGFIDTVPPQPQPQPEYKPANTNSNTNVQNNGPYEANQPQNPQAPMPQAPIENVPANQPPPENVNPYPEQKTAKKRRRTRRQAVEDDSAAVSFLTRLSSLFQDLTGDEDIGDDETDEEYVSEEEDAVPVAPAVEQRAAYEPPVKNMFEQQRDQLQKQLHHLQKQLELRTNIKIPGVGLQQQKAARSGPGYNSGYNYPPQQYYNDDGHGKDKKLALLDKDKFGLKDKKSKKFGKKTDILGKALGHIINKILDKLAAAIPVVLQKLFGDGLDDLAYGLTHYDDNYGYGNGLSLKSFGLIGYLPMIAMKLLYQFEYFVKILQKNKFLKGFLVPGVVLLGVSGLVVFLIWWLQSGDSYGNDYKGIGYGNSQYNTGYQNNNYGYSNNQYRSSYNDNELNSQQVALVDHTDKQYSAPQHKPGQYDYSNINTYNSKYRN